MVQRLSPARRCRNYTDWLQKKHLHPLTAGVFQQKCSQATHTLQIFHYSIVDVFFINQFIFEDFFSGKLTFSYYLAVIFQQLKMLK